MRKGNVNLVYDATARNKIIEEEGLTSDELRNLLILQQVH